MRRPRRWSSWNLSERVSEQRLPARRRPMLRPPGRQLSLAAEDRHTRPFRSRRPRRPMGRPPRSGWPGRLRRSGRRVPGPRGRSSSGLAGTARRPAPRAPTRRSRGCGTPPA
eukprot:5271848-Alexandrium_andersonii.AAC.1